jgi:hypothetical protein
METFWDVGGKENGSTLRPLMFGVSGSVPRKLKRWFLRLCRNRKTTAASARKASVLVIASPMVALVGKALDNDECRC